jgi:hypothetical protein
MILNLKLPFHLLGLFTIMQYIQVTAAARTIRIQGQCRSAEAFGMAQDPALKFVIAERVSKIELRCKSG